MGVVPFVDRAGHLAGLAAEKCIQRRQAREVLRSVRLRHGDQRSAQRRGLVLALQARQAGLRRLAHLSYLLASPVGFVGN
jgi:hypothetical protein